MLNLLIVGFGSVGKKFIETYPNQFRVTAVSRSCHSGLIVPAKKFKQHSLDLDDPQSLVRLAAVAENVVYLAPPKPEGTEDTRLRSFLRLISKRVRIPQRIVYVSTTGVYGDQKGARADETHPVSPLTERGKRRADAEEQIRLWAKRFRKRVVLLRVPGIYAKDRLPLSRLKQGLPSISKDDDSYSNHIHEDDLARIIFKALFSGRSRRIYNANDNTEMKMGDYFDLVADRCGLARPERLSRGEVGERVSTGVLSFMSESRKVDNSRMLRELKIRLSYPTVVEGVPFLVEQGEKP